MASKKTVEYIECKTYGHSWDEYNARYADAAPRGTDRLTLRCTRCGTTRHDTFDKVTGEVETRKYVYPSGYKEAVGVKPSRAALRLMLHGWSTRGAA